MKILSAFYDALLPELPGCTTAMVDYQLRNVARDFCDRTSAWQGEFDAIEGEAETLAYDVFTPESNSDLVRVLKLTIAGVVIWSAFEQDACKSRRPRYMASKPPFSIDQAGEVITLTEQPAGQILLVGSMKPKLIVSSLPDVLYDTHLDAIRVGVLSRLKKMSGKPWTDRDLAALYEVDFNVAMNHAAATATRGNTRALLRTRLSTL